jgi:hypothetical protein
VESVQSDLVDILERRRFSPPESEVVEREQGLCVPVATQKYPLRKTVKVDAVDVRILGARDPRQEFPCP